MNRTKIPWVKNPDNTPGYTWNPITGCRNHKDGRCLGGNFPCYAYRLANTRLYHVYMADKNSDRFETVEPHSPLNMPKPFVPRFWPERLAQLDYLPGPDTEPKGKGIFVCDMSDLFGVGVPEGWTRMVLDVIKLPSHTQDRFYLLTKQPQELHKYSPFPDNCYVGVSATDYNSFYRGAIHYLPKIKAKVKYISFEPLLEGMGKHIGGWLTACLIDADINWVIIGAQTKPTVMPKIEWVREIVEACDKASIPVFLKDSLKPLLEPHGTESHFFNYTMNTLRQEMPIESIAK